MRIVTFNINSKPDIDSEEKYRKFAQYITEKKVNVICLQEVNQLHSGDYVLNLTNIIYKIMAYLPSTYQFTWTPTHIAYDNYLEGIAIITNYNYSHINSKFISKSTDYKFWKTRKALTIKLESGLNVCCCHTGWFDDEQEPFGNQFSNLMTKLDSEEFIIGADLNIISGSFEQQDLFNKHRLYDLTKFGYSFTEAIDGWENHQSGQQKVDYIISNKNYQVKNQELLMSEEFMSDHNGFMVEI